ncbi:helix-turn-helix transcriptional regulator [Rhizobium leguminosarum]|uniref:helix-turn-helix domain-containing protein n=1 Tax=Rhizobium leguminosarum TaxID=384 RepID=UPI001441F69E|nr:XRE family transcriptional regulator [Rhizobium leguminosarum]MBY5841298.1 helix-turn-helix domain-containing protein [Rhizobium leguminosarum]NKM80943.1 helix-turn-helix domain-containing protein [Rhizobium leguminosarum bv. viciae]QSZ07281.1 helix-turn-helix transcriptional regulator [Rhizobium leguminosarum]
MPLKTRAVDDRRDLPLEQVQIGRRLSDLRKVNNWTLEAVSKMTGVGISTLSKLEKQQTSLSFDTWLKLSKGLGVSFQELVNPNAKRVAKGSRAVTRAREAITFATEQYDYAVHSTDLLARRMTPLVMKIKSRSPANVQVFSEHVGEEFILCLDGEVEVHTEHYAPLRLSKGDSAYIDATMKHAFVSLSKQDATILSVVSGTDSELEQFEDTMQTTIRKASG